MEIEQAVFKIDLLVQMKMFYIIKISFKFQEHTRTYMKY